MATSVPLSEDTPSLAVIDGFVLDCLLSDNHTFDSEVTEFPVESGSTISDNIRPKPLVITIEAIVSNTPLTFAGNFRGAGSVPSIDCYAKLLAIRRERRLVTIATSLETFFNMALESLGIPRAAGRGDELRFNATFKQVQIVINKRETRVAIPQAQGHTSQLAALVSYPFKKGVYIHGDGTWYDNAIGAWRRSWKASTEHPGKFELNQGVPAYYTAKEFDNAPISQTTDAVIRKRILKVQGGKDIPMFTSKSARNAILLSPGQILTGHTVLFSE
jgi:hypothetical protein